MKTRAENFMSMARAVAAINRKYQDVWAGAQKFSDYTAQLYDIIEQVEAQQMKAGKNITGARLDKAAASERALHMGANLSRRAIAYAEDRKLYELRNQLKIKRHDLISGHDSEILTRLRDLQGILKELLPQLADYSISQAQLDDFKQVNDTYESLLVHPREMIVDRKTHNQTVTDYVKVLRQLFHKMDHLVNVFEGTEFEQEYRSARMVLQLGTRHRPAKPDPETGNSKTT